MALAAAAALIVGVTASEAGGGPAVAAEVTCEYVELEPPGPAGNELHVTVTDYVGELGVGRAGKRITVTANTGQADCVGPAKPNISNLDRITVASSGSDLDSFFADLTHGPLGPGASIEPDVISEIELDVNGRGTVLVVLTGGGPDVIDVGTIGGRSAVNFNPQAELEQDADLIGARRAAVEVVTFGGADTATALGGTTFPGAPLRGAFIALGGPGPDEFTGTSENDFLVGEDGRDRLSGGRGRDRLYGGQGADRLACGPGQDGADTSPEDHVSGCDRQLPPFGAE